MLYMNKLYFNPDFGPSNLKFLDLVSKISKGKHFPT